MWGIIPAAGLGSRIQPLAFSKELLPVGSRVDGGIERPCAVSEFLLERMIEGGADKLCFVISPGKSDIMEFYGGSYAAAPAVYMVQQRPSGLCDALFQAAPLISPDEDVLIGLPDTIWFPRDGFRALPERGLSFLLFPVEQPELFDAVVTDNQNRVQAVVVKSTGSPTNWVWGALKMSGRIFHELHELWLRRHSSDEFLGTLVNAWIAEGGEAVGVQAGESYVDVGTLGGYRRALSLLDEAAQRGDIEQCGVMTGPPSGRSPFFHQHA